ncbi:MAG: hydantoinase B/oxoprolinase family protein [Alphaproteobacteria bacterium]|nr:hydantoinase B/oxoprolinase family protein [Alphaproteobacteria bacterium]
MSSGPALSPVQVGLVWKRLLGLMDEVAQAFVRVAFSAVIRENWDMAMALIDRQGRQFAQSSRSVPSFIGTLSQTARALLAEFPAEALAPGDVLATNDSWIGSGHLNDITLLRPIFRDGRLLCFVGSVFHSVDIGGAPSPHARDAFEEGLTIPPVKLYRAGEENRDAIAFIAANLRAPEETLGDIRAQLAAFTVAERRLLAMLAEEGIADLDAVVAEVLDRSERSLRAAIAALPPGRYSDELTADGYDKPFTIRCTLTVGAGGVEVDFAGTSPQIERPINSVLNYTAAWCAYAVKCALDPAVPNNDGAFRAVTVRAPEGSILNARRAAPVWARHLAGHYVPAAIFGALAKVAPERVVADCAAPIWTAYFRGQQPDGRAFVRMVFLTGGHGARMGSDGPSCVSFPSNIAAAPVEELEASAPLRVREKALRPGSGGAGRFRGGLGQRVAIESLSDTPVMMTIRHERVLYPPRGMLGGGDGAAGRNMLNGADLPAKTQVALKRGDVVAFETPGGGGLLPVAGRDPAAVAADAAEGYAPAGKDAPA